MIIHQHTNWTPFALLRMCFVKLTTVSLFMKTLEFIIIAQLAYLMIRTIIGRDCTCLISTGFISYWVDLTLITFETTTAHLARQSSTVVCFTICYFIYDTQFTFITNVFPTTTSNVCLIGLWTSSTSRFFTDDACPCFTFNKSIIA